MSKNSGDLVSNKRATHDYEILETFEAGICLQGTEIKSLRDNGGSLQEAYVRAIKNEIWLVGCSIAPFKFGNIYNHPEKRDRKLLLHKREIAHLSESVKLKGLALIPLSLYLKSGRVKVKIALAKGKKVHDKRAALKEREDQRSIDRMMKG